MYQEACQQSEFFLKKLSRKFFIDDYNLVMLNSPLIFPVLSPKVAILLPSKLLDVSFVWNNEKGVYSLYSKKIDDRKLSGLQYVALYIQKMLNHKIKNSRNQDTFETQQPFSILEATNYLNNPNAKLVNALNRNIKCHRKSVHVI